jgi:hypothetical protein
MVKRPTGTLSGEIMDTVYVDYTFLGDGRPYLHFGGAAPAGIKFRGTLDRTGVPPNSPVSLVQLVGATVIKFKMTGQSYQYTGAGLDNAYPMPNTFTFVDSNMVFILGADRPNNALPTNGVGCSRSDNFETFLMFKPGVGSSIDVPIRKMQWQWSGLATNSNGTWSLLSSNVAITATNLNATAHPSWTNNVANLLYSPISGDDFP